MSQKYLFKFFSSLFQDPDELQLETFLKEEEPKEQCPFPPTGKEQTLLKLKKISGLVDGLMFQIFRSKFFATNGPKSFCDFDIVTF